MDILVSEYVNQTFTEEYKQDILTSFDLFEKFNYLDYEESLIDVINNQSYLTGADLKDSFVLELNKKLDYVINQHEIYLTDEATVEDKIEIMSALYCFQNLEDYTGVIRMLESFESDYEILSVIISDICMLTSTRMMTILDRFSPSLLINMKLYITNLEATEENNDERADSKILINLKKYFKFLEQSCLAEYFIRDGIQIGQRFYSYISYCENSIVSSYDETTAKNFLSIILMSSDGYNNPLMVYRKYGYRILQDLNRVSSVETHVIRLLNNFNERKKAEDEKNRLL